jgi:hypothetical protein
MPVVGAWAWHHAAGCAGLEPRLRCEQLSGVSLTLKQSSNHNVPTGHVLDLLQGHAHVTAAHSSTRCRYAEDVGRAMV